MNTVEVCLSPDLISQYSLKEKSVVVVDILRATSCFTAGIASGVDSILTFADVDQCRSMKEKGYIIAGERGGDKVPGFDIGNSPFDYMSNEMKGKKIAATTTNGTKVIHLSESANEILVGSFLNLSAISEYLINSERDTLIFCAGWRGKVNLEDSLFAGALIQQLRRTHQAIDDTSLLCRSSYLTVKDDLAGTVANSEHAKRLSGFNMEQDISFCTTIDEFDVIPVVRKHEIVKL